MTHTNPEARVAQLRQHWDRFAAWCTAWDVTALPATPDTITDYLTLFPGSASVQRLRRQAIREHHHAAGHPDPVPAPPQMRVWPPDHDLSAVERLLATVPKYRFPAGVRGRRDAFLLVLLGVLGLSREQARRIDPADISLQGGVAIGGITIPIGADPAGCCACAATRWLRIVGPVWTGFRGDVYGLVNPTLGSLSEHDCLLPVTGEWQRAEQLLLPLDVHGWARTGVSLSGRSISTIVPARRAGAGEAAPETVGPIVRPAGRFDALSSAEAYDALGDADNAVDEAMACLAELQGMIVDLGGVVDVTGIDEGQP